MKSSAFRREWVLMILPVLGLVGVGLWAQNRPAPVAPKPTPGPFRLVVKEFKTVPLTPYEVSLGADTKVTMTVVTAGRPPGVSGWESEQLPLIYSLKTGKPVHDEYGLVENTAILVGGGGGGLTDPTFKDWSFQVTRLIRLRAVSDDLGALELRWNWAIGPNVSPAGNQSKAAKMQATLQSQSVPTLSARLPLRRAGEIIKKPVVSTDPLFDVRGVKITPNKNALRSGPIKVVVDVFYRGPKNTQQNLFANETWTLGVAGGQSLSRGDSVGLFKITGAQRRGELSNDFDFSHQSDVMKDKPLLLRGSVSIGGAWPKTIDIPIP